MVQWLRFCFQCRVHGLIPGQGTKILYATWYSQKELHIYIYLHIIKYIEFLNQSYVQRFTEGDLMPSAYEMYHFGNDHVNCLFILYLSLGRYTRSGAAFIKPDF